jgi:hypothetical protein
MKKLRSISLDDADITLTATARDADFSGGYTLNRTIGDAQIQDTSASATIHEFDLSAAASGQSLEDTPFESLDTEKATVNSAGVVTRQAGGSVVIVAKGTKVSKGVRLNITNTGAIASAFQGYATGSLAKALCDGIDTLLAAAGLPAVSRPLFTTTNHSTPSYVRNPNSWLAGIDMTGISVWNSQDAAFNCFTLISPRHVMWAKHYEIANDSTIRFVTADNQIVTATLKAQVDIGGAFDFTTASYISQKDVAVGELDRDIAGSGDPLSFLKVLPAGFEDYLPTLRRSSDLAGLEVPGFPVTIPLLDSSQLRQASVYDAYGFHYWHGYDSGERAIWAIRPTDTTRDSFFEVLNSGDSSSPTLMILNGEAILVSPHSYSEPIKPGKMGYGCSDITVLYDLIDEALASLVGYGDAYTLTEVDLSGFTSFA